MYLAQGYNTATRVRIETPTSRSGDRRSTTRPARLPNTDTCIVVPPLILHWKYDSYLFDVVFFHFPRPFSESFLAWDLDAITLK